MTPWAKNATATVVQAPSGANQGQAKILTPNAAGSQTPSTTASPTLMPTSAAVEDTLPRPLPRMNSPSTSPVVKPATARTCSTMLFGLLSSTAANATPIRVRPQTLVISRDTVRYVRSD